MRYLIIVLLASLFAYGTPAETETAANPPTEPVGEEWMEVTTSLVHLDGQLMMASGCGNRGGSPELDDVIALPQ